MQKSDPRVGKLRDIWVLDAVVNLALDFIGNCSVKLTNSRITDNSTIPDNFIDTRISFEQNRPTQYTSTTLHHYIPCTTILKCFNNVHSNPSANGARSGKEGKQKFPMMRGNLGDNPARIAEKRSFACSARYIVIFDWSTDSDFEFATLLLLLFNLPRYLSTTNEARDTFETTSN